MNLPQRVSITDCPHSGRHNGMEGFIEDRYADGTAGINLGYDHICIAKGWKEVTVTAEQPVMIRGEENAFDEVPAAIEALLETPVKKRRGRPKKVWDGESAPALRKVRPSITTQLDDPATDPISLKAAPAASLPLVSVSKLEDGRVSLAYSVGRARVLVEDATQDDLKSIQTIIEALTKGES